MQNFEYSLGMVKVTEQIVIGDLKIPREIVFEDGIPTVSVTPTKHTVRQGLYVDLNYLWPTLRQEKTIPELVSQMSSKDLDSRWEAVTVLATSGQPAFSSLVTALTDSADVIRERAAMALGKLRDPRAVKPLISLLNDKAWIVRWRAAWALGQMKGREQVVPLTQSLDKEKHEFVRVAITKALKNKDELKQ